MSIVFVIAFQIFDLSEDVTATAILQVKLAHAMMGYRGSEHKSPSTRPHEGPSFETAFQCDDWSLQASLNIFS